MTRVAVATALLLASAPASAWVRSRTSRGDELYWLEEQLVWHLDDAGSADLPEDDSELDAIRRSWATWDAVECDYGPFRMIFQEGPLMHAARAEYLPAGGNRNLLLWVDGVRTVSEVLERCRGEGAQAEVANVLAYLDLLTDLGYIEWVVQ